MLHVVKLMMTRKTTEPGLVHEDNPSTREAKACVWFCGLTWSVKQVPVPPRLRSVTVKKQGERAAKTYPTLLLRKVPSSIRWHRPASLRC